MTLHIGFLAFPGLQQLDLTGPFEIFASAPDTRVHIAAKTLEPIVSATGLLIVPTVTLEEAPQ
jgi:cyclohexyl-isocyanide hydratase